MMTMHDDVDWGDNDDNGEYDDDDEGDDYDLQVLSILLKNPHHHSLPHAVTNDIKLLPT